MRKENKRKSGGFPYDQAPMTQDLNETEGCFEQVNCYGTYNIQPTCDTDNFFPAIAQGLPKNAEFEILPQDFQK